MNLGMTNSSVHQARSLWDTLKNHEKDLATARDQIFNDCQQLLEKLSAENQDLSDNFEGQRLLNRDLKKTINEQKNKLQEFEMSLNRYEAERDQSLVICLVDGDGAVFHEDLLCKGQEGGREAARMLSQGILNDLDAKPRDLTTMIFINHSGLAATLERNDICTNKKFTEFVQGFNQATPLFTIVDVGYGKDAADAKLRDNLLLYSRLNQTRQVYFCGAHDGGYGPTLKSLQTEGRLDKVVVMAGSVQTAFEYKQFFDQSELRVMSIPGLFMQRKLLSGAANVNETATSPTMSKAAPAVVSNPWTVVGSPPGLKDQTTGSQQSDETAVSAQTPSTPAMTSSKSWSTVAAIAGGSGAQMSPYKPKPESDVLTIDPKKSLIKQEPRLCNFFYLHQDGCWNADDCKHSHKYTLTDKQLRQYREMVKALPCWNLITHEYCTNGEDCYMGHYCPYGPKCPANKIGTCKWKADGMHDAR